MEMAELKNIRNVGIRAITLDEDDELISVRETDGSQKILIATHDGMAICFCETDIRPMGRVTAGVRGIRLRKGDYCVGAARTRQTGSASYRNRKRLRQTDTDRRLPARRWFARARKNLLRTAADLA